MIRTYRLTILFAITAVVVIALAAAMVNRVIGDLAEDNLIRIAEENTARDTLHIQAMMRRGHSMQDISSTGAADGGTAMQRMRQPVPLTLESATGPQGLPGTYRQRWRA